MCNACKIAKRKLDKAIEPIAKELDRAVAPHYQSYQNAIEFHSKVYHSAIDSCLATYLKTETPLLGEYTRKAKLFWDAYYKVANKCKYKIA